LAGLCSDYGVPASEDGFVGDSYLALFPPALEVPSFVAHPARWPMRPVAWTEPDSTVPGWVQRRHRPLVYVTLGTMVATDDALRPVIEGVAALDVDVLVALGSAAGTGIGGLPANVHVEGFVDQAGVLELADVVVHHGGSGTVLAALAAGVPQVVIPTGADQFVNADRLAITGLASVLPPADATPDAVAAATKAALVDTDRSAVDLARAEIAAMAHPARIVDALADRYR
jgi:UDP:flavonoid glycosyltransferase YjiC (YdhE family)